MLRLAPPPSGASAGSSERTSESERSEAASRRMADANSAFVGKCPATVLWSGILGHHNEEHALAPSCPRRNRRPAWLTDSDPRKCERSAASADSDRSGDRIRHAPP